MKLRYMHGTDNFSLQGLEMAPRPNIFECVDLFSF